MLSSVTPEELQKLENDVALLQGQLAAARTEQGLTVIRKNILGTETRLDLNGHEFQITRSGKKAELAHIAELEAQLLLAQGKLDEALSILALIEKAKGEGIAAGKQIAVDAASVIDPEIRAKAVKVGDKGIADIENGDKLIAAGIAKKDRGQRELNSAKEFGY